MSIAIGMNTEPLVAKLLEMAGNPSNVNDIKLHIPAGGVIKLTISMFVESDGKITEVLNEYQLHRIEG